MDDEKFEQDEIPGTGGRPGASQLAVIGLVLVTTVMAIYYRSVQHLGFLHTSALFIGLPAVLAIVLAMLPQAKSATGSIVKGITFAILIVAPLLGEAVLCIVIASPLFYLVGVGVGAAVDWSRRRKGLTLSCCALVLVPLSLEGVSPDLTFNRMQTVEVTRTVAGSADEVRAALAQAPRVYLRLPLLLRFGFPRPIAAGGGGLAVGSERTVRFTGAEGAPAGDVVTRVTAVGDGYVRTEAVGDRTKLASWLRFRQQEVRWTPVDARHTRVTWSVTFERGLDPAWYFVPWERLAMREVAGYMIAANATPGGAAMIGRGDLVRVGALYGPVLLALTAGVLRPQLRRQFAACLLSFLWALPTLLVVERLNEAAGWWRFAATGMNFGGMPLELYLGWVVLWGLVPELCFPRLRLSWVALLMVGVDLVAMPLCAPLVELGPGWLAGEAVAVALVLVPALCFARWTLREERLGWRAAMQVATAGLLFLYLFPEMAFALRAGAGWEPLLRMAGWQRQLWSQMVLVCAIPGLGAVMEFAQRGGGTPIPYDPPKRLVVSGVYRYCANPMQLSCALVMLVWAALLRNVWLAAPALLAVAYSAGLAEWDEGADLEARFGDEWRAYRAAVRSWVPRWRPFCPGPVATIYMAASCGPCSELRAWLERRRPLGLEFAEAEGLAAGSIRRVRYCAGDGSAALEGVRAIGRSLEHANLAWALAGTALRLPVVWQTAQLVMDASGLGPREIRAAGGRCEMERG